METLESKRGTKIDSLISSESFERFSDFFAMAYLHITASITSHRSSVDSFCKILEMSLRRSEIEKYKNTCIWNQCKNFLSCLKILKKSLIITNILKKSGDNIFQSTKIKDSNFTLLEGVLNANKFFFWYHQEILELQDIASETHDYGSLKSWHFYLKPNSGPLFCH